MSIAAECSCRPCLENENGGCSSQISVYIQTVYTSGGIFLRRTAVLDSTFATFSYSTRGLLGSLCPQVSLLGTTHTEWTAVREGGVTVFIAVAFVNFELNVTLLIFYQSIVTCGCLIHRSASETSNTSLSTAHKKREKMSGGDVVHSGWLRKSPPEKKLRRYVSNALSNSNT